MITADRVREFFGRSGSYPESVSIPPYYKTNTGAYVILMELYNFGHEGKLNGTVMYPQLP